MLTTTTLMPEPRRFPAPACPDRATIVGVSEALGRGDVAAALRLIAEAA